MSKLYFFKWIGETLFPERLRKSLKENSIKAGLDEPPYVLLGILFILGIISVVFVDLWFVYKVNIAVFLGIADSSLIATLEPVFIFILTLVYLSLYFFIVLSGVLLYLDYRAFRRVRHMEEVLPDFLKSVSENLKGGTRFEEALWNSIKPEFGDLAKEMQLVVKRITMGESTSEALLSFANKYDSPEIKRTFSIISESLESGAKITPIVDMITEELVDTLQLKREIAATNLSYVIFIIIIVGFVSPFLFALSTQFLVILQTFIDKMQGVDISSLNMVNNGFAKTFSRLLNAKGTVMTPQEFIRLAYAVLTVTSIFSSFIISQIKDGNFKSGLKYIPLLLTVSLLIFTILVKVLTAFFSSIL